MIKLWHGDCLEKMKDIPDGSIDMVLCDLPYGTTQNKWDSVIPLNQLWKEYNRISRLFVFTAAQPFTTTLIYSNIHNFKYDWIWEKEAGTGFLNAKIQPLRSHESCIIFYKEQPIYNPIMEPGKAYIQSKGGGTTNYNKDSQDDIVTVNNGNRYPKTVLKFNRDKNKVHPTQKPVALMEYLILTYTNIGATVLDNCMGSGTTGVACVKTGRSFIGIEKEKNYFDISVARIKEAIEERKNVNNSCITQSL